MPRFKVGIKKSFCSPDEDIAPSYTTTLYYRVDALSEEEAKSVASSVEGKEIQFREYMGKVASIEVATEQEVESLPILRRH